MTNLAIDQLFQYLPSCHSNSFLFFVLPVCTISNNFVFSLVATKNPLHINRYIYDFVCFSETLGFYNTGHYMARWLVSVSYAVGVAFYQTNCTSIGFRGCYQ